MESVFERILQFKNSTLPVLITGESGTGKELIANAIHASSGVSGEFVSINVAGIDDAVFSDTLFGHKRGAFSGAFSDRKGLLEVAAKGTLLLDEISELSMLSQVKLLRLLQDNEYYKLGSDSASVNNARLIFATNKDLKVLVGLGTFREDLYYRLLNNRVFLPALRERLEDIPLLVEYFATSAAAELELPYRPVPNTILHALRKYYYPGNIRELKAIVYDLVLRSENLDSLDLTEEYFQTEAPEMELETIFSTLKCLPTFKQVDKALLIETLKRNNWNQSISAKILGISQPALSRRLKNYQLHEH